MQPTKKQIQKFIKLRNKSSYPSNMQFQIDAAACGFNAKDLGDAKKVDIGVYEWDLPFGTLREKFGVLSLEEA